MLTPLKGFAENERKRGGMSRERERNEPAWPGDQVELCAAAQRSPLTWSALPLPSLLALHVCTALTPPELKETPQPAACNAPPPRSNTRNRDRQTIIAVN